MKYKKKIFLIEDFSFIFNKVCECRMDSFNASGSEISTWKSTGISNHSDNSSMNAVVNSKGNHPILIMGRRMRVYSNGSYFTQNKALKKITLL